VERFLGTNLAIGIVLIGTLLAIVLRWRYDVAVLFRDPQPAWRALAWVAFGSTAALALWGTLADNWRKMVGEALDINEKYVSQRLVPEPVPRDIRAVTVVLLAVSLLTMAPLFARHVGGYLYQISLTISAVALFILFYFLRQRLDTVLATIYTLPPLLSFGMLATIIFVLLDYAANVGLLVVVYLGLLGLVALPVTVVLDLLRQREPAPDASSAAFYAKVHEDLLARRSAAPRHAVGNGAADLRREDSLEEAGERGGLP
jgi:hypothetical protein